MIWLVINITTSYLREEHLPPDPPVDLQPGHELPHHLWLLDVPHMVNLNVWLPEVGEEGEAHPLQVLHGNVHVVDPGVLPLDPQVHGQGDAGLLITDLGKEVYI